MNLSDANLEDAAALGERLLGKIPRLKQVAKIVGSQRLTGDLPEKLRSDDMHEYAGRFLRFVVDWDAETRKYDGNLQDGLDQLKTSSGHMYDQRLVEAAGKHVASVAADSSAVRIVQLQVEARNVRELDKLVNAIMTKEGTLVLAKDSVLTSTMVERIRSYSKSGMLGSNDVDVLRECPPESEDARDAA